MQNPGEPKKPDVSVIITTRNRAAILGRTLESLEKQDLSGVEWEIIVVDNDSSDDTLSQLEVWKERLPLIPRHEKKLGQNAARNNGLQIAQGGFFVFSDDDILFPTHWLKDIYSASQRWPDYAIFGGPIEPLFPEGTPDWMIDHPYASYAYGAFCPDYPEGPVEGNTVPFSGSLGIRARALEGMSFSEAVGPQEGKNYIMGSETELLRRLQSKGEKFCFVPTAKVQHIIREDQIQMGWLFRRHFKAARSQVYHSPDKDFTSARLWGVPRHLWRQLVIAKMRYGLSFLQSPRKRLEAGLHLHQIRGWMFAYREMGSKPLDSKSGK